MAQRKKGERIRPCTRCQIPIKFIHGTWSAAGNLKTGWHWVNDDGAHHRCADFMAQSRFQGGSYWDAQWAGAIERDSG